MWKVTPMQREGGAPTSTGKALTIASKPVAQMRGSVLDDTLASNQYDAMGHERSRCPSGIRYARERSRSPVPAPFSDDETEAYMAAKVALQQKTNELVKATAYEAAGQAKTEAFMAAHEASTKAYHAALEAFISKAYENGYADGKVKTKPSAHAYDAAYMATQEAYDAACKAADEAYDAACKAAQEAYDAACEAAYEAWRRACFL